MSLGRFDAKRIAARWTVALSSEKCFRPHPRLRPNLFAGRSLHRGFFCTTSWSRRAWCRIPCISHRPICKRTFCSSPPRAGLVQNDAHSLRWPRTAHRPLPTRYQVAKERLPGAIIVIGERDARVSFGHPAERYIGVRCDGASKRFGGRNRKPYILPVAPACRAEAGSARPTRKLPAPNRIHTRVSGNRIGLPLLTIVVRVAFLITRIGPSPHLGHVQVVSIGFPRETTTHRVGYRPTVKHGSKLTNRDATIQSSTRQVSARKCLSAHFGKTPR